MKSITINGSKRESVGKKATQALRNAGAVPCVLYGGDQPVHFSAPELAFSKLVYTPNAHTVVIALDDKTSFKAVLQDIQFHPVTDRILHIDFYQLYDDKMVTMEIPVVIVGSSPGVRNGGNLLRNKRKLKIKALPANLPDLIEADISKLKIGSKLYITELFSDKYTFLHPDNTVICLVRRSRASASMSEEDEETEGEEGEVSESQADSSADETSAE